MRDSRCASRLCSNRGGRCQIVLHYWFVILLAGIGVAPSGPSWRPHSRFVLIAVLRPNLISPVLSEAVLSRRPRGRIPAGQAGLPRQPQDILGS